MTKRKAKKRGKYVNRRGKTKYVTVRCPLCQLDFDIYRIGRHVSQFHADLGEKKFEALLRDRLNHGQLKYTAEKIAGGQTVVSSSKLLAAHERQPGDARTRFVSGGTFGLGKKR